MTDSRPDPAEAEPSLNEIVETGIRRVTAGLVIAGAIVGLALYGRPGPPRYEAFADGNRIVRIDTLKGTIISCEGQQTCQLILKSGQRLVRVKRTDAQPQPQALPKPAPAMPPPAAPAAGR